MWSPARAPGSRDGGWHARRMTLDRSRRARASRKRRRRFLAADNDLTPAQWAAIRAAWGCCAYCGDAASALQKDCVLPLSRGGRYTVENVVPACGSCNASKSNDEVTGWLRRKRLDEPAFLRRWVEIGATLRTQLSESEGFVDDPSTNDLLPES